MVCGLFGGKPLSEPIWVIVNLTLGNECQWNLNLKTTIFIPKFVLEHTTVTSTSDEFNFTSGTNLMKFKKNTSNFIKEVHLTAEFDRHLQYIVVLIKRTVNNSERCHHLNTQSYGFETSKGPCGTFLLLNGSFALRDQIIEYFTTQRVPYAEFALVLCRYT